VHPSVSLSTSYSSDSCLITLIRKHSGVGEHCQMCCAREARGCMWQSANNYIPPQGVTKTWFFPQKCEHQPNSLPIHIHKVVKGRGAKSARSKEGCMVEGAGAQVFCRVPTCIYATSNTHHDFQDVFSNTRTMRWVMPACLSCMAAATHTCITALVCPHTHVSQPSCVHLPPTPTHTHRPTTPRDHGIRLSATPHTWDLQDVSW
jgi:hypothetical protein